MRHTNWLAALLMFTVCGPASAALVRITFELTGWLGSPAPLPSLQLPYYTAEIDLDAPATQVNANGQTVVIPDLPNADRFRAWVIEDNDPGSPGGQNLRDLQFGQWAQYPNGNANSWPGGGFLYKTRISLVSGTSTDYTTIDGFFPDFWPTPSLARLEDPDAMWIVYDTGRWPNGSEAANTFVARVSSVTEIPAPSTLMLLGLVLPAAGLARRKSAR